MRRTGGSAIPDGHAHDEVKGTAPGPASRAHTPVLGEVKDYQIPVGVDGFDVHGMNQNWSAALRDGY
ncbi:hypothetical protein [Rhodococcus oxybenzonivorans]|uniref:hypothetical protein n=1 Tax=Rhodococcus oxybenzonivorans TaxID=1990687 RepID=UPI0013A5BD1B|nr:hypothetical protein [Rhodococcus oxybenzonivorans]